ncbi:MAG: hypothetical protein Q4G70_05255 [Pseudomonadota bacterium]|nr:hypothetical protein [Pseudomonadota bacterium]
MKRDHSIPVRAIRQAAIYASWAVWMLGGAFIVLGKGTGFWGFIWFPLGFAPYLLTLSVLEPWLVKRGLVEGDE